MLFSCHFRFICRASWPQIVSIYYTHLNISVRIGQISNGFFYNYYDKIKAICYLLCYDKDKETVPVPPETEDILQEKNKQNTELSHLEDLAFKSAADYFGDELIHWLGIPERAVRSAPTELVELETRHMYQDFLYEMENGLWYHFEVESDSVSVRDLRRFREYEASTSRRVGGPVITYVICSARAKKLRDSITEGINTYRVRLICLKDDNSDQLFARLAGRSGSSVSREDIIPLLLSPLMGGSSSQKDRILQGILLLKSVEGSFAPEEIQKMEAVLYAFAVKFLKNKDLEAIKEAIAMTKLGQMIWDDAIEKGREEWTRIGRQQASDRYSRLILLLSKEKKEDQIIKAASDSAYREELFRKYGR